MAWSRTHPPRPPGCNCQTLDRCTCRRGAATAGRPRNCGARPTLSWKRNPASGLKIPHKESLIRRLLAYTRIFNQEWSRTSPASATPIRDLYSLSSWRRAMIWTSVRSCSLYPIEMESSEVLSSLSMEDCELRADGTPATHVKHVQPPLSLAPSSTGNASFKYRFCF